MTMSAVGFFMGFLFRGIGMVTAFCVAIFSMPVGFVMTISVGEQLLGLFPLVLLT